MSFTYAIKRLKVNAAAFRRPSPHVLIFALLNVLYFLPLWAISLGGYEKGGVLPIGVDAHLIMPQISLVYLLGFCSFAAGSWITPKLFKLLSAQRQEVSRPALIESSPVDYVCFFILAALFIIFKILLIPEGAYSSYAFDSGGMESSTWTASMFFSDALVLASVVVLFSKRRNRIFLFTLVCLINGINLLHGTRNFLVIALLTSAVYAYTQARLSLRHLVLYGVAAFAASMLLAYCVFLVRSHVESIGFALLDVLSPIVYESVFSQISLISLLNHPIIFAANGGFSHLIQDVLIFVTPRLLLPEKGSALWISQFGYLSPLGAFNGLASGLLYFGYLFPGFYFCLGIVAGVLHKWAINQYGAILYYYFTCDFLFRIMRDGYVIPIKILINSLQLVFLLIAARMLARSFLHRVWLDMPDRATGPSTPL